MKYRVIKDLDPISLNGFLKIGDIVEPLYEGSDNYVRQGEKFGVCFNISHIQKNPEYWEKITEES